MNQSTQYLPLPPETEELAHRIIGCAIEVHRRLGPGYLESIYGRALRIEFEAQGLGYETEKPVSVEHRGHRIPGQRLDLLWEAA